VNEGTFDDETITTSSQQHHTVRHKTVAMFPPICETKAAIDFDRSTRRCVTDGICNTARIYEADRRYKRKNTQKNNPDVTAEYTISETKDEEMMYTKQVEYHYPGYPSILFHCISHCAFCYFSTPAETPAQLKDSKNR